jgi:hypothetical protein
MASIKTISERGLLPSISRIFHSSFNLTWSQELTVYLFHTTTSISQLIYTLHTRDCLSNICGFVVILFPWKPIINYLELLTAGPETGKNKRGNFSWNYSVSSYSHFVQITRSTHKGRPREWENRKHENTHTQHEHRITGRIRREQQGTPPNITCTSGNITIWDTTT